MTLAEKIETTKTLVGHDTDATDSLLTVLLKKAESAIRNRMYPFGYKKVDDEGTPIPFSVPEQYEYLQCDLAGRYFDRRGAEGETSHSENGTGRNYASVNDEDLLMEVMQVVV